MIDFIGDVHGHADELKRLLEKMGYERSNGIYTHPARKVVFIGDYIDRGPKIPETLRLVKSMVDTGAATALMGNHEYNAICFNRRNASGDWLRSRNEKNTKQHKETIKQFEGNEEEYNHYINWFLTLPLFIETPDFNATHACWDAPSITYLKGRLIDTKLTEALLEEASSKGTRLYQSVENVLKGTEIKIENWQGFEDKDGHHRTEIRVKWWLDPSKTSVKELNFTPQANPPDKTSVTHGPESFYSPQSLPVFFGHYWLSDQPSIQRSNVCCVDYSVAKQGKLVAYRWSGEKELTDENLVHVVTE
jgi:hypothetical protein